MGGPGSGSSGRLSDQTWPLVAAGCASIFSTFVSIISLWTHLKQYRKPIMQRYVVRIMLMVPLYAIASWCSLLSFTAADFIDPIRDVYEAFVIYCFFNLLVNYLGGERSIIIMTHGRAPKAHPWPMRYCCSKVDISDPYTFLTIKRGILQYAWLKPALALATVIMKATGTFQEGYIGLSSGYFWSGLLYNVSITISLYCLAMFWVCLHDDLVPFRPVPKFLVIKLVIFASYWQGFALSLLVAAGFIPDSPGYSADNISVAIQDLLTCFEMPFFALAHWYAFSVSDYADPTIGSSRMTILYAARDAFGAGDLMVDTKETLFGKGYDYQLFDPSENVMAHADSDRLSRIKEGLRYERGGKGKHWIPQPGQTTAKTPLLSRVAGDGYTSLKMPDAEQRHDAFAQVKHWNAPPPINLEIDDEDEALFNKAREMEFGDYNFPVV
ncbi:organic solute transporter Ostalpha-domain-containing protein, partial [Protomyces lactucae-debilis]